jgi:dTDP-4-amino-4,6-dideoxygalactose transaminase
MEFRDLKQQYQELKDKINRAISEVMDNCNFVGGAQISELETELSDYVGTKHCIACANGTDALSLALMVLGIGPGDAVFVPDFTFFSTGEVVSFLGATPVFVDVDEDTYNLDPTSLENAIHAVMQEGKLNPSAIIPVDLFGLPADYNSIFSIAKKYKLKVIEDGAQGFGGSLNGQKACSLGDISTTSFFPAKPLGCYGDGGAIFTDNDDIAMQLRSLRVHGKGSFKYDNIQIGMNSRLDTIQAAILLVKLKAFQEYELENINQVALWYETSLKGLYKIPNIPDGYFSSWAQYTIQTQSEEKRNNLQKLLKEDGVPSMVYYPKPMHEQTAFAKLKPYVSCPSTENLCKTVLSLPIHPYLSKNDCDKVCDLLNQYS